MELDALRGKANTLPLEPGVYLMMDAGGNVIYVGKAKALRNRVSQYFMDYAGRDEKTRRMVSQIHEFDVILVNSEFEALVLENSLIKRHMPRYNILLKDDKGYPYLRLSDGEYPQFSLVSRPAEDGARYFGPYGGRMQTRALLDAVRSALKLPACSRKFPRDIGKDRPCLNHHMGLCHAYCRAPGDPGGHRQAMEQAVLLLEGKYDAVSAGLQAQMEQAAEELRFERAAELRDRLRAIENLGRHTQHVVDGTGADTDVVGFSQGEVKCALAVLHYVDGALTGKELELFDTPAEIEARDLLGPAVTQYFSGRTALPREILLPDYVPEQQLIEQMLSEQAGRRVILRAGVRGDRRRLVALANRNAQEEAERATSQEARVSKLIFALQKLLDMERPPLRIEAFDVSHTAGDEVVASMTVFENTRAKKRDYRRYKIKTIEGQDDYGSMREVLSRRVRRIQAEDEAFGAVPDLLLIDGGAAHAGAVRAVLEEAGLYIPVFGMVKDDRHRTRALETPDGREVGIQGIPAIFSLIGRIQEETHRFAVEYHRERRSKKLRHSELDGIPGVGDARKKALLKQFGSVKAIRQAQLDELAGAVPRSTALAVYDYFHKEEDAHAGDNGNGAGPSAEGAERG